MMTTVVRSLHDDNTDDGSHPERVAALERVTELLNEAQETKARRDTEWVVDLASRRIVRKAIREGSAR